MIKIAGLKQVMYDKLELLDAKRDDGEISRDEYLSKRNRIMCEFQAEFERIMQEEHNGNNP